MSEKCSSQYREPHGSPMGEGASTISPVALRAAVPTNSSTLTVFLFHVTHLWRRTLRQRSQKDWTTWERIKRLADDWLPKPRIRHPWPESRFAFRHPRWEPYARIGPVRICAGARGNSRPYRESGRPTVIPGLITHCIESSPHRAA